MGINNHRQHLNNCTNENAKNAYYSIRKPEYNVFVLGYRPGADLYGTLWEIIREYIIAKYKDIFIHLTGGKDINHVFSIN